MSSRRVFNYLILLRDPFMQLRKKDKQDISIQSFHRNKLEYNNSLIYNTHIITFNQWRIQQKSVIYKTNQHNRKKSIKTTRYREKKKYIKS